MTPLARRALLLAALTVLALPASASAAPRVVRAPALAPALFAADTVTLEVTVGIDPTPGNPSDSCPTTGAITVEPGQPLVYCFRITNNSATLTLTTHTLADNRLGSILTNFPFSLGPGASAFTTKEATRYATTTNTATWTASNATATLADSDSAKVTVKKNLLTLRKTVGVDPTPGDPSTDTCPTADVITVPPGTPVVYCFTIENTSTTVTVDRHTLVDAALGTILTDFPYVLVPGASAFLTQEAVVRRTTAAKATWTSRKEGLPTVLSATDVAIAKLPWCPGHRTDSRTQVVGTPLAEVLVGTPGRDVICGGGGNDTIRGRGGNDLVKGGRGADRLLGEGGADRLHGEAGADRLVGGPGRDRLTGGAGRDTLFARDGVRDLVDGGSGRDRASVDRRDSVSRVERFL